MLFSSSGRIEAQAGPEGRQALGDGPTPRTPAEQGGRHRHRQHHHHGDRDGDGLLALTRVIALPRRTARPQYDRAGACGANTPIQGRNRPRRSEIPAPKSRQRTVLGARWPEGPAPGHPRRAPMAMWHLADVSLNPSVNALPGGGTLQELTNGLAGLGAHRCARRPAHGPRHGRWASTPRTSSSPSWAGGLSRCPGWPPSSSARPRRSSTSSSTPASTCTDGSPLVFGADCGGLDALNPVCQLGSAAGSVATSGMAAVLDGVSQWVASGAEWLLGQVGDVLVASTAVDVGAGWFREHYGQMTALAGRGSPPVARLDRPGGVAPRSHATRPYVPAPHADGTLVGGSRSAARGARALSHRCHEQCRRRRNGRGRDHALRGLTTGLAGIGGPDRRQLCPLLVSLVVAVAAFVLWLELLIRSAAVYVAVLSSPWHWPRWCGRRSPHWCRRLC